jgi:hypothetical protein
MKKLIFVSICLLMLSGCFATSPRVIIVDSSLAPGQLLDEREVKVRYIDPQTQQEVITTEKRAGNFLLTPSTYKKLIQAGLENKTDK